MKNGFKREKLLEMELMGKIMPSIEGEGDGGQL